MTIIVPDVSPRLKPDFLKVVQTIYVEMANLQPSDRVLVMSDARTPDYISSVFHGMAIALGADAVKIEVEIPGGGPTYQPSAKWSPMLAAAAAEATLLIDLAVGYADFVVAALKRGARVLMPGDGIGGPYLDDMLIRTIRDVDIHAIRRTADRVAEAFTRASTCQLITGDGETLNIDIRDLTAFPGDGFLWDRDKNDWKSQFAILPPAQPGITLPRGVTDGTVLVDGTVLWHQNYHEEPRVPLKLRFERGRLVDLSGDKYLANRIRNWLDTLDDDQAREGPNHLNIGINPNALLTQNQEWERVYGSVTCGMGDMSIVADLLGASEPSTREWATSKVHWDWTVMQPTVVLDDRVLLKDGRLFLENF